LTATIRNGRTRGWVMRRRRRSTLIPALMEPSRPAGRRCSLSRARKLALFDSEAGGSKRLEIRPPAAVELRTLRKRRGRTGSAPHGSFSLFKRVEKSRMNNSQTEVYLTSFPARSSVLSPEPNSWTIFFNEIPEQERTAMRQNQLKCHFAQVTPLLSMKTAKMIKAISTAALPSWTARQKARPNPHPSPRTPRRTDGRRAGREFL